MNERGFRDKRQTELESVLARLLFNIDFDETYERKDNGKKVYVFQYSIETENGDGICRYDWIDIVFDSEWNFIKTDCDTYSPNYEMQRVMDKINKKFNKSIDKV